MGTHLAVLTFTHDLCFEGKKRKEKIHLNIAIFSAFKNRSLFHRGIIIIGRKTWQYSLGFFHQPGGWEEGGW